MKTKLVDGRSSARLRPALLAVAFAAAVALLGGAATAQDQDKEELVLERPTGVDDETWERARKLSPEVKRELARLAGQLAAKAKPDFAHGSLESIVQRSASCRSLYGVDVPGALVAPPPEPWFAFDVVGYRNATRPRLNGAVQRELAEHVGEGTTVVLDEGKFRFPESSLSEVLIVGAGVDRTVLHGPLPRSSRVKIVNARIDLGKETLRHVGRLHLQGCIVSADDTAIALDEGVLLAEGCEIRTSYGTGIAATNESPVYACRTRFVGCTTTLRSDYPAVFDRCVVEHVCSELFGWPGGRWFFTHASERGDASFGCRHAVGDRVLESHEIPSATDDADFVLALARGRFDEWTKKLVQVRGLDLDASYWIALLVHPDATVREVAREQLRVLVGDALVLDPLPEPPGPLGIAEQDAWVVEHLQRFESLKLELDRAARKYVPRK